jgi:hypothetical protein
MNCPGNLKKVILGDKIGTLVTINWFCHGWS